MKYVAWYGAGMDDLTSHGIPRRIAITLARAGYPNKPWDEGVKLVLSGELDDELKEVRSFGTKSLAVLKQVLAGHPIVKDNYTLRVSVPVFLQDVLHRSAEDVSLSDAEFVRRMLIERLVQIMENA